MQINTIIASNRGRIYSSLIITYPVEVAPSEILTLAIKTAGDNYMASLGAFKLARGEIPTTLPFKAVRVLKGRGGSLILLANDDFVGSSAKDPLYEVKNIILAVHESKYVQLADGLAYLLNEMDKNHIVTSRMRLWPYLYNNPIPTMSMLDKFRDENLLNCSDLAGFGVERIKTEEIHNLSFINLAQSRFQDTPKETLTLKNKKVIDSQDKIIAEILDGPSVNLVANLKVSTELLKNLHPQKPAIVDNAVGNNLLLRSIIVCNWLVNSNNADDKRRAARMVVQYKLPVKSLKEDLLTAIWTLQWERVTWMGYRAISLINGYRNELTGSQEAISLLRKRTIVLLLFPIFFGVGSYFWSEFSIGNDGYFPFTLLSALLAVFAPFFGIGLFQRLAKFKLKKLVRNISGFSFVLVGVLLAFLPIQLDHFYSYLFLSVPIIVWLIWVLIPVRSKVGVAAFLLMLLSIPFSSMLIGSNEWHLLRQQLESYTDVNIIISQFADLAERTLNLLNHLFGT